MLRRVVYEGEHVGLKFWVIENKCPIPLPFMPPMFYTAYVELPVVLPTEGKEIQHSLITGKDVKNYDELFEDIDVHGGITFAVCDGKRTIVGWDYAHFDDLEMPPLEEVIEECQNAAEQLKKWLENYKKEGENNA